jgi:hypothetical protein
VQGAVLLRGVFASNIILGSLGPVGVGARFCTVQATTTASW